MSERKVQRLKFLLKTSVFIAVVAFVPSCASQMDFETAAREREHMLNWTCESFAKKYRKDRKAHPELCEGYDDAGWPVDGAKIGLPKP